MFRYGAERARPAALAPHPRRGGGRARLLTLGAILTDLTVVVCDTHALTVPRRRRRIVRSATLAPGSCSQSLISSASRRFPAEPSRQALPDTTPDAETPTAPPSRSTDARCSRCEGDLLSGGWQRSAAGNQDRTPVAPCEGLPAFSTARSAPVSTTERSTEPRRRAWRAGQRQDAMCSRES